MCFSQEYSGSFALFGLISLYIFKDNKKIKENLLFIPIVFYTIMEILQTIQYSFVNQCENPINRYLTELAYILILVQPIMWNILFLKKKNKLRTNFHEGILYLGIILCAVWMLGFIFRRFDFWGNMPPENIDNQEGCQGTKVCTYKNKGEHLYWNFDLRNRPGLDANWFMFFCIWLIPLFLIPGEKVLFSSITSGLLFSYFYTLYKKQNRHILASLWCLISSPTLFVAVIYYGFFK